MADNEYKIDYAKRVANCKNRRCAQPKIEPKSLRIAKLTKNPFSDDEDSKQAHWFHPPCIFDQLKRAKKTTKKIESTGDLIGWENIDTDDQKLVVDLIDAGYEEEPKPKARKTPKSAKKNNAPVKKTKKSPSAAGGGGGQSSIAAFFNPQSRSKSSSSSSSSKGAAHRNGSTHATPATADSDEPRKAGVLSSFRAGSRGAVASGLVKKPKTATSPSRRGDDSGAAAAALALPRSGVRTRLETANKFYDIVVDGRVVFVISGFKVAKFTKPKRHEIQRGSGDSAVALAAKLVAEAEAKGYKAVMKDVEITQEMLAKEAADAKAADVPSADSLQQRSSSASAARWEWKSDNGWAPYDQPTSDEIQAAYELDHLDNKVPLTKGYFAKNSGYFVNFFKMVQRHDARSVMRAIRAAKQPKVDPKVAVANALKKAKAQKASKLAKPAQKHHTSDSSSDPSALTAKKESVLWQWKSDDNWQSYADATNKQIEAAYQVYKSTLAPSSSISRVKLTNDWFATRSDYVVNFSRNVQSNLKTDCHRAVRRHVDQADKGGDSKAVSASKASTSSSSPPNRSPSRADPMVLDSESDSDESDEEKISASSMNVRWEWRDDRGGWTSYDAATCDQIETAFQDGKSSVKLTEGTFFSKHKGYQLDFAKKVQRNVFTNNRRVIRRVSTAAASAAGAPSAGSVSPPPAKMSKQPTFVLSPDRKPPPQKKAFQSSSPMKSRFFQSSSSSSSSKSSTGHSSKSSSKSPMTWEWRSEKGWKPYDIETAAQIEAAFANGDSIVALSEGAFFASQRGGGYEVDFDVMLQTDTNTDNHRKIRRVSTKASAAGSKRARSRDPADGSDNDDRKANAKRQRSLSGVERAAFSDDSMTDDYSDDDNDDAAADGEEKNNDQQDDVVAALLDSVFDRTEVAFRWRSIGFNGGKQLDADSLLDAVRKADTILRQDIQSEILSGDASAASLTGICKRLYALGFHDFGKHRPPLLHSLEHVRSERRRLLEIYRAALDQSHVKGVHLTRVEPSDTVFKCIDESVSSTQVRSECRFVPKVANLFKVSLPAGEPTPSQRTSNSCRLVWHVLRSPVELTRLLAFNVDADFPDDGLLFHELITPCVNEAVALSPTDEVAAKSSNAHASTSSSRNLFAILCEIPVEGTNSPATKQEVAIEEGMYKPNPLSRVQVLDEGPWIAHGRPVRNADPKISRKFSEIRIADKSLMRWLFVVEISLQTPKN